MTLTGGYGHQFGSAVLGLEAGVDLADPLYLGEPPAACDPAANACINTGQRAIVDRMGHVRGLLGVAIDPKVMVFAAVGAAFANVEPIAELQITINDGESSYASAGMSELVLAPTFGVGVDYRPIENLRIRVEGLMETFTVSQEVATYASASGGVLFIEGLIDGTSTVQAKNVSARISALWEF